MSAVVTSVHTYIRHKFRSDRIPQKKIQDVVGEKKKQRIVSLLNQADGTLMAPSIN